MSLEDFLQPKFVTVDSGSDPGPETPKSEPAAPGDNDGSAPLAQDDDLEFAEEVDPRVGGGFGRAQQLYDRRERHRGRADAGEETTQTDASRGTGQGGRRRETAQQEREDGGALLSPAGHREGVPGPVFGGAGGIREGA